MIVLVVFNIIVSGLCLILCLVNSVQLSNIETDLQALHGSSLEHGGCHD